MKIYEKLNYMTEETFVFVRRVSALQSYLAISDMHLRQKYSISLLKIFIFRIVILKA